MKNFDYYSNSKIFQCWCLKNDRTRKKCAAGMSTSRLQDTPTVMRKLRLSKRKTPSSSPPRWWSRRHETSSCAQLGSTSVDPPESLQPHQQHTKPPLPFQKKHKKSESSKHDKKKLKSKDSKKQKWDPNSFQDWFIDLQFKLTHTRDNKHKREEPKLTHTGSAGGTLRRKYRSR